MKEVRDLYISQLPRLIRNALNYDIESDDMKSLIKYFIDHDDAPADLEVLIKQRLSSFLENEGSMDKSFGLVNKPSRKHVTEQIKAVMAFSVFSGRMEGLRYIEAVADVSIEFDRAESVIGKHWEDSKIRELAGAMYKLLHPQPFTGEEQERFDSVLSGKQI